MRASPFRRFLDEQGFVVLDGGLATALEAAGHDLRSELWSARLLVDEPEAIGAVHTAYLEAGADCIGTATYQASFGGFEALGLSTEEAEDLMRSSVGIAAAARTAFWSEPENRANRIEPIIAASAGPYGAFLADGSEYDGRYGVGPEVLEAYHRPRLDVLADTEADLIGFETIPSLPETEVIARLLSEKPDAWAWLSFSCRDGARLWDGSSVVDAVRACEDVPALAGVGVNCTHPRYVAELVERIGDVSEVPVIAYPNSGETYDPLARAWDGTPTGSRWLDYVPGWITGGVTVIGGCCRVGPDMIRGLRASLSATWRRPTLPAPTRPSED